MYFNDLEGLLDRNTSIIVNERKYDYKEIINSVKEIKNYLIKYFYGKRTLAICLDRDESLIFSMLAALSSEITYVLIDSNAPKERREFILKDSGVEFIITNLKYQELFEDYEIIVYEEMRKIQCYEDFEVENSENEIAYICYTSGSSGKPKGVEVTFKGLENFNKSLFRINDFKSGHKIACLTTSMFDIFYIESIFPLTCGLTLVMFSETEASNPRLLKKKLLKYDIDIIQMTPSRMQMLLFEKGSSHCIEQMSTILLGGEKLGDNLLKELQNINPNTKIYNFYGPTETTVYSTYSELSNSDSVNIGKPILNTEILIMREGSEATQGDIGEIYIGGDGVANGYKNLEYITAQKFITMCGKKYFKTGDLGYIDLEGNINCLGRIDNQIKINGFRVEIEEIENILMSVDGIKEAIVYYHGADTCKILVALYTSNRDIDSKDIKSYLKEVIPNYMIPQKYYRCVKLFCNERGKLDRNKNYKEYIE